MAPWAAALDSGPSPLSHPAAYRQPMPRIQDEEDELYDEDDGGNAGGGSGWRRRLLAWGLAAAALLLGFLTTSFKGLKFFSIV